MTPPLPERYRPVRRVGVGGMGEVWEVEDTLAQGEIPRRQALKILRAEWAPRAASRFGAEFRILASLRHPNLARVFEYGHLGDGRAFYTSELCGGDPLGPRAGRIPIDELCAVLAALCRVIDYLAARGVVHNDVKPSNILMVAGDPGSLKLVDFGLADAARGGGALPAGTPPYMAPERLRNAPHDHRADLYAVGVTIYRLVTGSLPVDGDRPSALLTALGAGYPSAAVLREDCPSALDRVLARLMAPDPRDRPARGAEVIELLAEGGLGRFPLETPGTLDAYALSSAFVGRSAELDRLLEVALGRGKARVALVRGPAGAGKSRLIEELRLRLLLGGVRAVAVRCAPGDAPFRPMRELLRRLGSEPDSLPDARQSGALALEGEAAQHAIAAAIADRLSAAADGASLVAIMDDLDRADDGTLETLDRLAQRRPRGLAIIGGARDGRGGGHLGERADAWLRRGDAVDVPLAPLGASELRGLLDSLFGADVFDRVAQAELLRRSAGTPLLLEEIVRGLLRRGALHATGHGWKLRAGAMAELASDDALSHLLRERLDALPPGARAVADALAVIGRPVGPVVLEAVARVAGGDAEAVARGVERLLTEGLAVHVADEVASRAGHGPLALFHESLAEAAVAALDADKARTLHLRTAHALEAAARASGRPDADAPARARHLLAAGELAASFPLALRAGLSALALGDMRGALSLLRDADGAADAARASRADRARLQEALADALGSRETAEVAGAAYARAAETVSGDPVAEARIAGKAALVFAVASRAGEADAWIARADGASAAAGSGRPPNPSLELARLRVLRERGDHAAVVARGGAQLQAMAARSGDRALDPVRRDVSVIVAAAHIDRGELGQARERLREAAELAARLGDVRGELRAGNMLGSVEANAGDLPAAMKIFEATLERAVKAGVAPAEAILLANLGEDQAWIGEYARAEETLERAASLHAELGMTVEYVDSARGALCVLKGKRAEARALLEPLVVDRPSSALAWTRVSAAVWLAVLSFTERDAEGAARAAGRARAIAGSSGVPRDLAAAGVAEALASALAGRTDSALDSLTRAEQTFTTEHPAVDDHGGRPDVRAVVARYARARVLAAAGRMAEARRDLASAAEGFDAIGNRTEAARSRALAEELSTEHDGGDEMKATEVLAALPAAAEAIRRQLQRPSIFATLADEAVRALGASRVVVALSDGSGPAVVASRGNGAGSTESAALERISSEITGPLARARRTPGMSVAASAPAAGWAVAAGEGDGGGRIALYLEGGDLSPAIRAGADLLVGQAVDALRAAQLGESLRNARKPPAVERGIPWREALTMASAGMTGGGEGSLGVLELTVGLPTVANRGRSRRLVGRSRPIKNVFALVRRVARQRMPVLVIGETGTGKELIARAIHAASPRVAGPFVAVNCASIPPSLAESELFGHLRGAFTGADRQHRGLFEQADGGTLFLDEIGEMDIGLQAKLLRVLDEGIMRPLGAQQSVQVDVRVVAATNRNLASEVAARRFRQDLYFRLAGVEIVLPPLRERRSDVSLLVERLLAEIDRDGLGPGLPEPTAGIAGARVSPDALAALEAYEWPGNVRELENELRRARLLAGDGPIGVRHLSSRLLGDRTTGGHVRKASGDRIADAERDAIERALRRTGGNKLRAAKLLGISREGLRAKLKRHGLGGGAKP